MVTLLAGTAHAAGEGAPVSRVSTTPALSDAAGADLFSDEWRERKVREREAHLRALDDEQRRFDKWERNARQAVGGICDDCLGSRSGHAITVPGSMIPNVPGPGEGLAGFDEASSYYVVAPASAPQPTVAAAPVIVPAPLPEAPRAVPSASSAPLDIRTPAGR